MVSPESLHRLLDAEIAQAQAAESRPGWSEWLIIASLAGTIWALTSEVSAVVNWHAAIGVTVAVFLALDAVWAVRALCESGDMETNARGYRPLRELTDLSRLYALVRAARYWLMVFGFLGLMGKGQSDRQFFMSAGLLVYMLVAFVASLLVIATQEPNEITRRGRHLFQLPRYLITALIVSSLFLALTVLVLSAISSRLDVRVGGLIAASAYLVILLANARKQSPMLATLMRIRRQLVLNQTTAEAAAKETDMALLGMTVSHAMQGWVAKLANALETERAELLRLVEQCDASDEAMADDTPIAEYERKLLLGAAVSGISAVGALKKDATSWTADLAKMDAYGKRIEADGPEYRSIREKLLASRKVVDSGIEVLAARLEQLRSARALTTPARPPGLPAQTTGGSD